MLERIAQLADKQQAGAITNAEVAACIAAGKAMSVGEALQALEDRTIQTATDLKGAAETIDVDGALQGVADEIGRLDGYEDAEMDVAPFLWVPRPETLQSLKPAQEGTDWPVETYGVAGWNITWRNCKLGSLSLFLFQNHGELTDGALQAAVVPLSTPAPRPGQPSPFLLDVVEATINPFGPLAPKATLVDAMLREGSETARRRALEGAILFAKQIRDQMAAQAAAGYPADKGYVGSGRTAAMYYIGQMLFDKRLHSNPTRHLQLLSLVYNGKYQEVAEQLGVEEWPTDPQAFAREQQNKGKKKYSPLCAQPHMAPYGPAKEYMRLLGHLTRAVTTGFYIFDHKVFDGAAHDTKAWEFPGFPWLYRSADSVPAVQAAFALPVEGRRRRFGRHAGGVVGRHAVAVSADSAPLAQAAHKQIQDIVSAPYLKQLGA